LLYCWRWARTLPKMAYLDESLESVHCLRMVVAVLTNKLDEADLC
jgi:hypothetical protein